MCFSFGYSFTFCVCEERWRMGERRMGGFHGGFSMGFLCGGEKRVTGRVFVKKFPVGFFFWCSFVSDVWGFIDVEGRLLQGNEIKNRRKEWLRCVHKKRE